MSQITKPEKRKGKKKHHHPKKKKKGKKEKKIRFDGIKAGHVLGGTLMAWCNSGGRIDEQRACVHGRESLRRRGRTEDKTVLLVHWWNHVRGLFCTLDRSAWLTLWLLLQVSHSCSLSLNICNSELMCIFIGVHAWWSCVFLVCCTSLEFSFFRSPSQPFPPCLQNCPWAVYVLWTVVCLWSLDHRCYIDCCLSVSPLAVDVI